MKSKELPSEHQPPKTPLRILCAEDHPEIRKMLAYMLSHDGYSFECVSDGQQALDRVTASPASFDIVITDHHMPHLDGLKLVERLRQTTFAGKILVFSSSLTRQHRVLYNELGVDGTFSKPTEARNLLNALANLQNNPK